MDKHIDGEKDRDKESEGERQTKQRQRFSLAIAVEAVPRASPPHHISVIDLRKIFLYYCRTKAYALDATFFLPIAQRESSLYLAVAVALLPIEGVFIYLYLLCIYL